MVENHPAGVSEARNRGVDEASAPYVAFLDADDYVDPDMYSTLMKVRDSYDAEIVYCNFINEFPDGTVSHQFADSGEISARTPSRTAYEIIMDISTSTPCQKIYPREFLSKRRFPAGVRFEDHAVMFRWMSEARRIVHVDRPMYHYIHHSGNFTSDAETNIMKLRDFFNAECIRIDFIREYDGFTAQEKKATFRKSFGQAILAFKRITARTPCLSPDNPELASLRRKLLGYMTSVAPSSIGIGNYLQLLRIRHLWKSFAKKQQAKLHNEKAH